MSKNTITIFEVCDCILAINGEPLTTIKLQKLSYYVQAWSLVLAEEQMFEEEFIASVNGAKNLQLYELHKNRFKISNGEDCSSCSSNFTAVQREIIEKVVMLYGKYNSQQLCDLNRNEDPWLKAMARSGVDSIISLADMREYYAGLHF